MATKKPVASKPAESASADPLDLANSEALRARMLKVSGLTLSTLIACSDAEIALKLSVGPIAVVATEDGCGVVMADEPLHFPDCHDMADLAGLLLGGAMFQRRHEKF